MFLDAAKERGNLLGVVFWSGWYSVNECRRYPELTFVFGDNLRGFGKGGQAVIRGEPNTFGIPTKRLPAMAPGSFFEEGDRDDLEAVLLSLQDLWKLVESGHTIVVPVNDQGEISLGLERAQLRERAPSIYEAIVRHINEMADAHGKETANGSLATY